MQRMSLFPRLWEVILGSEDDEVDVAQVVGLAADERAK
jgi:hypothetical protein